MVQVKSRENKQDECADWWTHDVIMAEGGVGRKVENNEIYIFSRVSIAKNLREETTKTKQNRIVENKETTKLS